MFNLVILSCLLLICAFSAAAKDGCDISGIWDHAAKPAKLFVDLSKGEVSVHSHENNTKATGLVVLKKLELDSASPSWNAKMYSAAEDSFVDVQLTSEGCNQLSVSFKSEEVLRLLR